jgi:predicted metal-dependent hydrolase
MARKPSKSSLVFNDYHIPVIHYKEYRASIRFSITKKGLIIRSPIFSSSSALQSKATTWCKNLAEKKPAAIGRFKIKNYEPGDSLILMEYPFILNIISSDNDKDSIKWEKDKLHLIVNNKYSVFQKSEVIAQLLAQFAAKRFKEPLTKRVEELNSKYFNVAINQVRLKNNHSNWGSCSSKGNINLSTRLLFAPQPVIDYVIIHELAHRIELNHSQRFWKLVADRCPDYKIKEKWLKANSHLCEF